MIYDLHVGKKRAKLRSDRVHELCTKVYTDKVIQTRQATRIAIRSAESTESTQKAARAGLTTERLKRCTTKKKPRNDRVFWYP